MLRLPSPLAVKSCAVLMRTLTPLVALLKTTVSPTMVLAPPSIVSLPVVA